MTSSVSCVKTELGIKSLLVTKALSTPTVFTRRVKCLGWSSKQWTPSPHWSQGPVELKTLFDSPDVGLMRMNWIHFVYVCQCLLWLEIDLISISGHQHAWVDGRRNLLQFCPHCGDLTLCQGIGVVVLWVKGCSSTRVTPGCSLVTGATLGRRPLCFRASILTGIACQSAVPWGMFFQGSVLSPALPGGWAQIPRVQDCRTHSPLWAQKNLSNLVESFSVLPAFPQATSFLKP